MRKTTLPLILLLGLANMVVCSAKMGRAQRNSMPTIANNMWPEGIGHGEVSTPHIQNLERYMYYMTEQALVGRDARPNFIWDTITRVGGIMGTPPPSMGDWIIYDTTIVEDSVLIINGSIIVSETGALILKNSEIYMNLTIGGEHWIDVYGNLTVLSSLITAYNTSNNYFIRVFDGGKLRIENSEISYAGYEGGLLNDKLGIWINTSNAIIRNTTIHNSMCGVYLYKTTNVVIANNVMLDNSFGIYLDNSEGNMIYGNKINHSWGYGIYIDHSVNNDIYNNTVQDSLIYGVCIAYSDLNNVSYNRFFDDGLFVYDSFNCIVEGNTVNSKPLLYLEGEKDLDISTEAGQIILVSCQNITIHGQHIVDTDVGIELWDTRNVKIYDNILEHNRVGICLASMSNTSGKNCICLLYTSPSPRDRG